MPKLYESSIEQMAIEELESLGYTYISGVDLAPDSPSAERSSYGDVLLVDRLRTALKELNPDIPTDAIESAIRRISRIATSNLLADNEEFHRLLIEGVPVEYRKGSDLVNDNVFIVNFNEYEKNEFLVINQYTIIQNNNNRRPDVLLFINGIPMVLFELKNPADENATCYKAYEQIQTYKAVIPALFTFNEVCVISDGLEAKAGSLTASFSRYSAWKTKDGMREASKYDNELSTLIHGLCSPETLIDYMHNFVTFEKSSAEDKTTSVIKVEMVKRLQHIINIMQLIKRLSKQYAQVGNGSLLDLKTRRLMGFLVPKTNQRVTTKRVWCGIPRERENHYQWYFMQGK